MLTSKHRKIINFISEEGNITVDDVIKKFNVSRNYVYVVINRENKRLKNEENKRPYRVVVKHDRKHI